jgi:hypothetical protein
MAKKRDIFYPNWQDAYELLKAGWDITVWFSDGKIQMFKQDLTEQEDVYLRQKTYSALRIRNLIKEAPSGALAADVYILR